MRWNVWKGQQIVGWFHRWELDQAYELARAVNGYVKPGT